MTTTKPVPLVCDMTAAPDSPQERMAEYRRLFEHALAERERIADAVIWRFTARPGVEAWVRDLAAREAMCCPFLSYTVTVTGERVVWEIAGDGDPRVRPMLDMIQRLPDELADGVAGLLPRLAEAGVEIRTREEGSRRA